MKKKKSKSTDQLACFITWLLLSVSLLSLTLPPTCSPYFRTIFKTIFLLINLDNIEFIFKYFFFRNLKECRCTKSHTEFFIEFFLNFRDFFILLFIYEI